MPLLGAHMSIEGGVDQALVRGRSIGCETVQIFVTSPNRWKGKALTEEEIARFRALQAESGIWPVIAHDTYLINLGSPDEELYRKSLEAFQDELERCVRLQLPYLVMHPGSHMGAGEETGLQRIIAALDLLREEVADYRGFVLLETTAGQGHTLGYRFEQLAQIIAGVREPGWLGVCLDTCHAFAAGYELRTPEGYQETWRQFEATLGLERLKCVHLNDSKGCLGCRLDRHAHIGEGQLGLEPFRMLLNDPRFRSLPMVLETPKGPQMAEDVRNLAVLRSLITES